MWLWFLSEVQVSGRKESVNVSDPKLMREREWRIGEVVEIQDHIL